MGDAARPFAGPLAKFVSNTYNAVRTAKALRVVGAGIEFGIGATRAAQGYFAIRPGNTGQALGTSARRRSGSWA